MFAALLACGRPDSSPPPALLGIEAGEGTVGWRGIVVGMTAHAVEQRLGLPIAGLEPLNGACAGSGASLALNGAALYIAFSGGGPDAIVQSVFVPLSTTWTTAQLVAELRQRVRGLRYQPSPYAPELREEENPTPLYVLADHPDVGILVKPDEGLWFSLIDCLD